VAGKQAPKEIPKQFHERSAQGQTSYVPGVTNVNGTTVTLMEKWYVGYKTSFAVWVGVAGVPL
jgi:hypothetical protein